VLLDHFLAHPWAISSATVSNDLILVGIAPDTYRDMIGTDLSFQEETVRIVSAQAPDVSAVFPIVEGENAIVQSCPVFAPDGTYLGYVDLTYRPDVLIGRIADPVLANTTYDALVIQTDGAILYSTDAGEIGRNVFSDPACQDPEHKALFARVAAEPSGTGFYRSPGPDHENMVAAWSTAGTDGCFLACCHFRESRGVLDEEHMETLMMHLATGPTHEMISFHRKCLVCEVTARTGGMAGDDRHEKPVAGRVHRLNTALQLHRAVYFACVSMGRNLQTSPGSALEGGVQNRRLIAF